MLDASLIKTIPASPRDFVEWLNRTPSGPLTVISAGHPAWRREIDIQARVAHSELNERMERPVTEGEIKDLVASFIPWVNGLAEESRPGDTHEVIKILGKFPGVRIPDGDLSSVRGTFKWVPSPDSDLHSDVYLKIAIIFAAVDLWEGGELWRVRLCPLSGKKPRCNGWFAAADTRQKWCSERCRKVEFRSKPKAREKNREYQRKHRKKKRREDRLEEAEFLATEQRTKFRRKTERKSRTASKRRKRAVKGL